MKIKFRGLISHVRLPSGESIAVLLREPMHIPELTVPVADIDNPSPGEQGKRPLSNRRIGFGAQGAVNRSGLAGVPSLVAMTGSAGTLDDDLRARDTARNFAAFVDLPGGPYSIEDWFEKKGDATNLGPICVPRTVVLEWDATTPVTITGVNPTLTVKPGATISITNLENGAAGRGFDVHGNIFSPPRTVSLSATTETCPKGTPIIMPYGVTVECSNSTYP